MYNLKVMKLNNDAIIPNYAHFGDAGLDLYSVENIEIDPGCRALVKTGISIELPLNTEAQIRPRSGLALKHGITVLNSPGTIDYQYRGEIGIVVINHGDVSYTVLKGSKIAQMVIVPVISVEVEEVSELTETKRNKNGFGSTGV